VFLWLIGFVVLRAFALFASSSSQLSAVTAWASLCSAPLPASGAGSLGVGSAGVVTASANLSACLLSACFEDGSLLLLDEETDELVFVLVHGDIKNKLRGHRMKSDMGIAGWVAQKREPLIVNNPRQDIRFSLEVDEEFSFVTRSILCVPMITRGKLIGVIEVLNKQDNIFAEADATLLLILAQVAAIALEEMQTRLEAEEEAQVLEASA
jgi:GAF domain-containing protein